MVFTRQGFQTVIRDNVTLVAEQTVNLKVKTKPGDFAEAITITGQEGFARFKSTSQGMTLTREVFDVLPKGRDVDGLVTVIPGASNEALLGGLSIAGASGGENMFYVDGQNTNSVFGGIAASRMLFSTSSTKSSSRSSGYLGRIRRRTRRRHQRHHPLAATHSTATSWVIIRAPCRCGQRARHDHHRPPATVPTLRVFNYADRGQGVNRFAPGRRLRHRRPHRQGQAVVLCQRAAGFPFYYPAGHLPLFQLIPTHIPSESF